MRTRGLSWRPRAMFCASSSGSRCWEFRSSDTRRLRKRRVSCETPLSRNSGHNATRRGRVFPAFNTDAAASCAADKEPWRPMSKTIWVGAVAYNPKVVTIWEGMRRYFHEEARLPVDVVLFQSYEAQVIALLAQPGEPVPRIDIAWNTNLAYLQADEWSGHACRAVAMRDTDLGWMTKIVAATGGPISTLADLKNRTLAIGSRDSGHATILPIHFLEQQGMREGRDYRALRFDSDLGKHGDTGTGEVEVVRAVPAGRSAAAATHSPFCT